MYKYLALLTVFFVGSLCSEKKMLTCEIQGGLGNQMFQIATTLATAWDQGYEPIFPRLVNSPSFLSPRPVYWSSFFTRIPTIAQHTLTQFKSYIEPRDAFIPIPLQEDRVKLVGYWQSPKYFDHYRERILSLFQPTEDLNRYIDKQFYLLTEGHEGPVVSLHLRRGDYMQLDGFMCLWQEKYKHYYIEAVSSFPKETLFMVFSDEPSYAKAFFFKNFSEAKAVFPSDKDYVEVYLMGLVA